MSSWVPVAGLRVGPVRTETQLPCPHPCPRGLKQGREGGGPRVGETLLGSAHFSLFLQGSRGHCPIPAGPHGAGKDPGPGTLSFLVPVAQDLACARCCPGEGRGGEPEAGPEPLGPQPLPVREAGAGSSLTVLLKMKTPRGCPRSFHERLSQLRADLSPGRACTAVSSRRRVPRPLSGECPGPRPRFPVRADPLCSGLGQPVTMPSTRNNALIVTAGPGSRRGNVRRGAPSYHARRERGWAPAHTKT